MTAQSTSFRTEISVARFPISRDPESALLPAGLQLFRLAIGSDAVTDHRHSKSQQDGHRFCAHHRPLLIILWQVRDARGRARPNLGYLFNERAVLADYARLAIPVCLIAGRHSPASSRRVATLLAQNLARAALHWVDAGHMAPITHAECVNAIIAKFLNARASTAKVA